MELMDVNKDYYNEKCYEINNNLINGYYFFRILDRLGNCYVMSFLKN